MKTMVRFAVLCCASCGGSGEPPRSEADPDRVPPAGAVLRLAFDHRLGSDSITLGTPYTTPYGQTVTFDHIRYWVSHIELADGDTVWTAPDSYALIEDTPQNTRLQVDLEVPPGTYDAVSFHIGVDPAANADADLTLGELARGIGMDWGTDPGYKFFRTEGTFEEQEVSGSFAVHTGGDVLYKKLTAKLADPLLVAPDDTRVVTAQADFGRLFAGIELGENPEILGGSLDSPAGRIAANYGRMFTLLTETETVVMNATSPNLEPTDTGDDAIPSDATPPVLSTPVIALDALHCVEVPTRPAAAQRACMTPFVLGMGAAYQDAGFFTFVTASNAKVQASSAGVVSTVAHTGHNEQTTSDIFSVTVRPNTDSAFFVEYRNLKNIVVVEGDAVVPGQQLGSAGDYYDPEFGSVSFGIRREQTAVQRLCPTRYTTEPLTGQYEDALSLSNAAWPDLAWDDLCATPSLACAGPSCDEPADFQPAYGDIESGRKIYKSGCASCHGTVGEGGIAPPVCTGPGCSCPDCLDHPTLAASVASDMPPEGQCRGACADDVAAFILYEFVRP